MAEVAAIEPGILEVRGALTLANIARLQLEGLAIIDDFVGDVRIDLKAASFEGVSGLSLLLSWKRHAAATHRAIEFINASETAISISKLAEVDEILGLRT